MIDSPRASAVTACTGLSNSADAPNQALAPQVIGTARAARHDPRCYRDGMSGGGPEVAETAGVIDAFDAATRAIAGLQSVDAPSRSSSTRCGRWSGRSTRPSGSSVRRRSSSASSRRGSPPRSGRRSVRCPRGHGFLGLIIRENRSFRIPDIASDPRRTASRRNHPAMHRFLGVPVTVKGRSVGNLYLTDKVGASGVLRGRPAPGRDVRPPCRRSPSRTRASMSRSERLAIVDERERISTDLHDGIIQSLYAVGPVARGRAGARARGPGRGRAPRRARDRQPPPRDPRHPQLHLRPAPRAPRRDHADRTA